MNSISPLSDSNNKSIEDQMKMNNDLIPKDNNSIENSTNNDNTPSKNNMKIIIPLFNASQFLKKAKSKKTLKGNILDFDKVLDILIGNKEPKRKKKKKKVNKSFEEKGFLHRKKARLTSMKKKVNKNTYGDKDRDRDRDCKGKDKKIKTNTNNLYSIDNFISSTMKIVEKKEFVHIECPKYKEIFEDYEDVGDVIMSGGESDEDISEKRYKTLHWPKEEFEINRRIILNSNKNDKKKKIELKEVSEQQSTPWKKIHSNVSHTDSTVDEKHCA